MASQLRYRPDTDGLRAVAIICVVLYHLKIPGFRGGFVGVDFFFAISGFLILSILNKEYEANNRVDWLAFYARRIRRLLPEATVMMAAVMVIGYFVLLPLGEQQSLAESGIAGALWVANLYFWRFGGEYFSPSIEQQPLLHLWSLGVEGQFYLAVPVMFLLASELSRTLGLPWRRSVIILLCILGLISLGIAAWGTNTHSVAAYYLLPTRAYEFAIGGLAALWLDHSQRVGVKPDHVRAVTLLGVTGIFLSLATASWEQKFPSAWALLPTSSTALILWSGGLSAPNSVQRVLESRPLVHLGKISYGWYLWHFPLLVLWREYWLFDTSVWGEAATVCLAILPAAVGYYLVSGLRQSSVAFNAGVGTKQSFSYAAFAVLAVGLISGSLGAYAKYIGSQTTETILLKSQLDDLYTPSKQCFLTPTAVSAPLPECTFGDPNGAATIVVWGDSHANHWIPALEPSFTKLGIRGVERARGACPPALQESKLLDKNMFGECELYGENVLRELVQLKRSGPVGVILSARWAAYINRQPISRISRLYAPPNWAPLGPAIEQSLKVIVTKLSSLQIPIGILLQVPEQRFIAPVCLRRRLLDQCEISRAEVDGYFSGPKTIIAKIAEQEGLLILDPEGFLCGSNRCALRNDEAMLYVDENHLSKAGAKSLSPFLKDFVEALKKAVLK